MYKIVKFPLLLFFLLISNIANAVIEPPFKNMVVRKDPIEYKKILFKDYDENIIKDNSKDYIEFYGSSSEEANEKHYGGLASYRSSEGKKVRIEYRSSLEKTVKDILGGIRSSCTYVGAPTLKQLSKCTTFVRVNNQYNDVFGKV